RDRLWRYTQREHDFVEEPSVAYLNSNILQPNCPVRVNKARDNLSIGEWAWGTEHLRIDVLYLPVPAGLGCFVAPYLVYAGNFDRLRPSAARGGYLSTYGWRQIRAQTEKAP